MRPVIPVPALRPATFLARSGATSQTHAPLFSLHNLAQARRDYATSKRRSVTPFNDDGHVAWGDLSAAEKAARATQQTFNLGFIVVGVVLTGGVGYFLWTEVFSTESKVTHFNRAVDRIKKDDRCLELLGDAKKITAHGEETHNRWARSRPIASTERTDPYGNQHIVMNFYVEGPRNRGTVAIHLVKYRGHKEFEYKYFYVDVKGHSRIYLENAEAAAQQAAGSKGTKLFGIRWT